MGFGKQADWVLLRNREAAGWRRLAFSRQARNSMVRGGGVGNVGRRKARHVTLDTAILRTLHSPKGELQLAAGIGMTNLTASTVIVDLLGRVGVIVRIVAADAA